MFIRRVLLQHHVRSRHATIVLRVHVRTAFDHGFNRLEVTPPNGTEQRGFATSGRLLDICSVSHEQTDCRGVAIVGGSVKRYCGLAPSLSRCSASLRLRPNETQNHTGVALQRPSVKAWSIRLTLERAIHRRCECSAWHRGPRVRSRSRCAASSCPARRDARRATGVTGGSQRRLPSRRIARVAAETFSTPYEAEGLCTENHSQAATPTTNVAGCHCLRPRLPLGTRSRAA